MIDHVFIKAATREVFIEGGGAPSLSFTIGSTFDLHVGFMDDAGGVIALADAGGGRMIVKPVDQFTADTRFLMPAWSVSGEGAQRRYKFRSELDSGPLRSDLANAATKQYQVQIEYRFDGGKYISDPIPLTVINSYFQATDAAPDLPLGGPEATDFHAEIFPPSVPIASGMEYAANINRGGDIHNVRFSVESYQSGLTLQVLVDGSVELFTEPVALTGQTVEWTPDDIPNKLALTALERGARIDVQCVWTPTEEYPEAPTGLVIDIALRTRTTIEAEGWGWIKERFPESQGYTHDEGGKIVEPPVGLGGAPDWGDIGGTLADQTDLQDALEGKSSTGHTHAYADLTSKPTLGTAAALDVGTTANKVVQLDGTGKLPALDGSQLTGLPSGVSDHGALTGLFDDDHPQYHTDARGDARYSALGHTHAYADLTSKPPLGTAAALDVGTTANKVVQLDGTGKLPALDGSQLTGLPSGVSDHGALTGLGDDDHAQYHTDARGDARYDALGAAAAAQAAAVQRSNHTGTQSADSLTDGTTNKAYTATEKTKLAGIATGANAYTHPDHTGDVTSTGDGVTAIASDAVTNAKLANMAAHTIKARKTGSTGDPEDCTLSEVLDLIGSAAQGDILYRGASGWTRLAAGTSGHFLKTLGAAADPQWAAASGGGGSATWQLLATVDITSAVATVDITGLTGHRKYRLDLENVYCSSDNVDLRMRLSTDAGSTFISGASDYTTARSTVGTYAPSQATAAFCALVTGVGSAADEGVTGHLELWSANNAALETWYEGHLMAPAATAVSVTTSEVVGRLKQTSNVNAIRIYFASGNVAAGKIRIFGWNE